MYSSECLSDEEMNSISKNEFNSMNVLNTSNRRKSLESFESRETSYLKFMSTLPRLCSPTICGTVNYKTPNRQKWCQMSSLEYKPFEWSIEQKAVLDPCDFSNTEDMDLFRQIDNKFVSKQLDEENDRFFSQKLIIPSPKTPEKQNEDQNESEVRRQSIIWSPMHSNDKTPEYQTLNRDNISIECFKTPLNCSKSRQKKKLFREDHYLMETVMSRSPKDSAFETIDSQSLLSPIFSSDWKNTSLSKRITHLSPIQSQIHNYIEMDFNSDEKCLNDRSMKTKTDSYSDLNYDMLSIESQSEDQNISIKIQSDNTIDTDLNVFYDYNRCQRNVFQKYLTKTSTPSHL